MKFKTFDVKASEDGAGFTGYASVFDNIDAYGDIMRKGAFTKSLADYGKDGAGVPAYWGHRMDDPMMNIGITTRAVEDDHGLLVEVRLGETTEVEKQVRRLLLEGRVKQMSFAFDYVEAAWVEKEGESSFYEVREVRLHEVSVVPVGANQETEILSAKARDVVPHRKDADAAAEVVAEVEQAEADVMAELVGQMVAGFESLQADIAELRELVLTEQADPDDGDPDPDAETSDEDADTASDETPKSVTPAQRAAQAIRIANLETQTLPRGQEGDSHEHP